MFDLNTALELWLRPFRANHIYSDDTIEELSGHLLDRYAEYREEGLSESEAFDRSVTQIGQEDSLREEHLKEWRAVPWYQRLWSLFRQEWQWIQSPLLRSFYLVGRVWTIGLGLWWGFLLPFVFTSLIFDMFRYLLIDPNQWFYLQGRPLHTLISIAAIFILVPFKSWSNKPESWFRVTFVLMVLYTILHNLRVALLDLRIHDGGEALMWEVWLGLAPMLWLIQLRGRRSSVAVKREAIIALDTSPR